MYEVVLTASAVEDLEYLDSRAQGVILGAIEQQLKENPIIATRNRKPLRPNDLAAWEVRMGDYRVFYDVRGDEVVVKAVGLKEHSVLLIRGKEYKL